MIYYKYHPLYFFFVGSEDSAVQLPNSTPLPNLPYSFGNDSVFVPASSPGKSGEHSQGQGNHPDGAWEYSRNQQGYEYDNLSPALQALSDAQRDPNFARLQKQLSDAKEEADAISLVAALATASTSPEVLLEQENTPVRCLARIDAMADTLIRETIGDRAVEYLTAEQEATAFAANNFEGDAPQSVVSWALASSLTDQQSAESILAAAHHWRTVSLSLRQTRLIAKQQIRDSESYQARIGLMSMYSDELDYLRNSLND
jgi:hypothetical protein